MPESHIRRTYLIDRRFQLKYIVLLSVSGAVLAALCGLWAWQAYQQAVEFFARDPEHQTLLRQVDRYLLWALAGIGLLSAAVLGLVGFVMTHRVAGPIWVMGHAFGELARGRYPARRGLRRSDELKAFHARFYDAVEALAERERRTLSALEQAISRIQAEVQERPALRPALDLLDAEAKARREALAGKS